MDLLCFFLRTLDFVSIGKIRISLNCLINRGYFKIFMDVDFIPNIFGFVKRFCGLSDLPKPIPPPENIARNTTLEPRRRAPAKNVKVLF